VKAVDGVSFSVDKGRTLGIVGESGSGKSVTALSIMGLLPRPPAKIVSGEVLFEGRDLVTLKERALEDLRGREIAMIFQDPMTSLNPVQRIGTQIAEVLVLHTDLPKEAIRERCVALLREVGIPQPEARLEDYPHQFSGGMRQRVMIAMALALDPELLIADEPTTALDVTVQAQIMSLLAELQRERNMGLMLITHDMGVVADVADRISIMYAGRIVEEAPVYDIYGRPAHPYTKALLESIPRLDRTGSQLNVIGGLPPALTDIPRGCPFHPRCAYARDVCAQDPPPPA
jgi:oligopeptide transport system ATP-binding protein